MRIAEFFDGLDGAEGLKANSVHVDFAEGWREKRLTRMSEAEIETFFDELILVLEYEGPEQ